MTSLSKNHPHEVPDPHDPSDTREPAGLLVLSVGRRDTGSVLVADCPSTAEKSLL